MDLMKISSESVLNLSGTTLLYSLSRGPLPSSLAKKYSSPWSWTFWCGSGSDDSELSDPDDSLPDSLSEPESLSDPDPSPQAPPQPQRPGVRGRSSPGDSNKARKKSNRNPEAGDEVIIETDKGAIEFKVIEKVNNQESDSLFRVAQIKDGKSATLNFKRVKWNVKSPQDI